MKHVILLVIAAVLVACQPKNHQPMISNNTIQKSIALICATAPNADTALITRGVEQVATLWRESDGTEEEFHALVTSSYAGTSEERQILYNRIVHILEQCSQSADMLNNTLHPVRPAHARPEAAAYLPQFRRRHVA